MTDRSKKINIRREIRQITGTRVRILRKILLQPEVAI